MAGKQPQGSGPTNFQQGPPTPSSFNFSYVEQGKEPPPPQQHPPAAMSLPHPNFPVTPAAAIPMHPMLNPGFGSPQPPKFNPQFGFGQNGPPPEQFPPLGSKVAPADGDFPPLGSEKPAAATPDATEKKDQTKAANSIMIPSVVASKALR